MVKLFLVVFYILVGIALLGLLGVMVLHTMAEYDARRKERAERSRDERENI